MFKFRCYFMTSLILFLFFSVCCVSACDVDNVTLDSVDNSFFDDDLSGSYFNDNFLSASYSLKGGSFEDIQDLVDKAKSGDTIRLSGTFKSKNSDSLIKIDKKLNIVSSSGAVLNAQSKSGIFYLDTGSRGSTISGLIFTNGKRVIASAVYVDARDVTIKGCTFKNNKGTGGGGGAVATTYTLNGAKGLTITDCVFTGNSAPASSGALAAFSCDFKIINCLFENNKASNNADRTAVGGAVIAGINQKGTYGVIRGCTFKNNNAKAGYGLISTGGALGVQDKTTVEDCIFTGNGADGGGAIYVYASATIKNCEFTKNTAKDEGGAIIAFNKGKLSIQGSEFKNNVAKYGGAIYSEGDAQAEIKNTKFISNNANYGGAIFTASVTTLEGCDLNKNTAKNDGGAVFSQNKITITSSNFNSNGAENGGGIYILSDKTATLKKAVFDSNIVVGDGGAIYANCVLNIDNSDFNKNSAEYGGAILALEKTTIINSNFNSNNANTAGSIYLETNKESKFENSYFKDNNAEYAGVIYNNAPLKINNCDFIQNYATVNGGVILNDDLLEIINSRFSENLANEYGGVMFTVSLKSHITVYSSDFNNNYAQIGGVFYNIGEIIFKNAIFKSNMAYIEGGAIFDLSQSTSIEDCHFVENQAKYGGGICSNANNINILNSLFNNNEGEYGGAIWIDENSEAILTNNTFSFNNALNGSVIYNNGSLKIYSCNFNDNLAQTYDIKIGGKLVINKGEDIFITAMLLVGDNVCDAIFNNNEIFLNDTVPKQSNYAVNKEIILDLDNESYSAISDENGIATFRISSDNLNEGNYTLSFWHESKLYTFFIKNETLEIQKQENNSKNVLKLAKKAINKKYSSKTTKKKPSTGHVNKRNFQNKITAFNNKLGKLGGGIGNAVKNEAIKIKDYSDGNPLKALDYPVIKIPGYKNFMKNHKIAAEVIDIAFGINPNGQMSILDLSVNVLSLLSGFGVGARIIRGIGKSIKVGKKLPKVYNLFNKINKKSFTLKKRSEISLLNVISDSIDFAGKPLGSTIVFGVNHIISKSSSIIKSPVGKHILKQTDKLPFKFHKKNFSYNPKKIFNNHYNNFGTLLSYSSYSDVSKNLKESSKRFKSKSKSKTNPLFISQFNDSKKIKKIAKKYNKFRNELFKPNYISSTKHNSSNNSKLSKASNIGNKIANQFKKSKIHKSSSKKVNNKSIISKVHNKVSNLLNKFKKVKK